VKALGLALLFTGIGVGLASVAAASNGPKPNLRHGRALFRQFCSDCHTLKAAGTHGIAGPNLDKYPPPSRNYIVYQVTVGGGIMPAFTRFTVREVNDIAAFVWARKCCRST
jgi:mono/diheme cytochrome c family protein